MLVEVNSSIVSSYCLFGLYGVSQGGLGKGPFCHAQSNEPDLNTTQFQMERESESDNHGNQKD